MKAKEKNDEEISRVKAYYDANSQREWERMERHPFEFIFTSFMMDKYISEGDSILDIGGGPGRYSIYYAKKGCKVTLVDLSDGNVALAKEKAKEAGVSIQSFAANCLDLDNTGLGLFDHVFLMGPLYHLKNKEDRMKAVRIALSHLKKGGKIYVSFILDFAGFIYDMKEGPGFLPEDDRTGAAGLLCKSVVTHENYYGPAFTSALFVNQKNIEPLMDSFKNLKKVSLFGQEGITGPNENKMKDFPEEEKRLWIEYGKKMLEEPSLLSYSEHAMYIGEKTDD